MSVEMLNIMLADYASVVARLAEMERIKDELNAKILEEMKKGDLKTYEHESGTFSVVNRKSVEWDADAKAEIEEYAKNLKETKAVMLSQGHGTEVESQSLRFQATK